MIKHALIVLFIFSNLLISSVSYADQDEQHGCNDPFITSATKNGYTWTLTSKFAQILREAERRYGQRRHLWTLLGIEFTTDKQPKVWYPYAQQGEKFIIVQLTQKARCNPREALFQLSHEVIHLLSPIGGGIQSNVFEEGLASYFAIESLKKQGYHIKKLDRYISHSHYQAAYQAIASLYNTYPQSDAIIATLRQQVTTFKQLSPQQLQHAFPKISLTLIQQLLRPFE